ncbi:DsbC family protein [Hydrogenophaga sp.]|uniref:DsbC family protein n=1 Tax=Hydrogenophaga sp. TaxID=1904254 RepID=UPI0025B8520C|nr:DsbC family protein [Hydrogenophaga sp.]
MCLLLSACSPQDSAPASTAAAPIAADQAHSILGAEGKGFTVGALMGANPVYVLFDPQCPHCGHLWNSSLPLHNKVKFVWLPVAIINAKSLPQGAALMQAANPLETMTQHEQALLAGQGGMSASSSVPDEVAEAIKVNTGLLNRLGADSVPFIVARHPQTGQVITRTGSMATQDLASLLGL